MRGRRAGSHKPVTCKPPFYRGRAGVSLTRRGRAAAAPPPAQRRRAPLPAQQAAEQEVLHDGELAEHLGLVHLEHAAVDLGPAGARPPRRSAWGSSQTAGPSSPAGGDGGGGVTASSAPGGGSDQRPCGQAARGRAGRGPHAAARLAARRACLDKLHAAEVGVVARVGLEHVAAADGTWA